MPKVFCFIWFSPKIYKVLAPKRGQIQTQHVIQTWCNSAGSESAYLIPI